MRAQIAALVLLGCVSRAAPPPQPVIAELPRRPLSECDRIQVRDVGPLDVAILLDISLSTAAASGADIDRDGRIGRARGRGRAASESTDPGDSILAAQVAGARSLVHHLRDLDVRFAVIAFSEVSPPEAEDTARAGASRRSSDAFAATVPTQDAAEIDAALGRVLEAGSAGGVRFAGGMLLANRVLTEAADLQRDARLVALMVSDSARPLLTHPEVSVVDPAMKSAAVEAIRALIRFHTFGLNEAAGTQTPHALSRIAGATGGSFAAVADATLLHCHMLRALLLPR